MSCPTLCGRDMGYERNFASTKRKLLLHRKYGPSILIVDGSSYDQALRAYWAADTEPKLNYQNSETISSTLSIYIYIIANTHIYICVYTFTYTYIYIYIHTYIYIYICISWTATQHYDLHGLGDSAAAARQRRATAAAPKYLARRAIALGAQVL